MDIVLKDKFLALWKKYFNSAALPITFYYTDKASPTELVKPGSVPRCIMGALVKIQKGQSLAFDADAVGCPGGKRYLGFSENLAPNFEYFLSCGIPGKLEGERYKKTPEMVKEYLKHAPAMKAPGRYIVLKDGTSSKSPIARRSSSALPRRMSFRVFLRWTATMRRSRTWSSRHSVPAAPASCNTLIWKLKRRGPGRSSACSTPPHGLSCRRIHLHSRRR